MSGTASTLADPRALWAALSSMTIGAAGAEWRFEEALADANGWSAGHAARVVAEYRRFLYLAAISDSELTPSRAVDEAWHLHLDTPSYRDELCGRILGRPLDHRPGTGAPDEEARFRRQYEETLALYARTFGETPPADIWPRPDAAAAAEPERPLKRTSAGVAGLAALAAAVLAAAAGQGAAAIALCVLAGLCLAAFFLRTAGAANARSRQDGNCGGGCGGATIAADADGGCGDGAGCGGGGCAGD